MFFSKAGTGVVRNNVVWDSKEMQIQENFKYDGTYELSLFYDTTWYEKVIRKIKCLRCALILTGSITVGMRGQNWGPRNQYILRGAGAGAVQNFPFLNPRVPYFFT